MANHPNRKKRPTNLEMFFQGDVALIRLPDSFRISRAQPIVPKYGQIILAEGEVTGHHHAINLTGDYRPGVVGFRDDGMARDLSVKAGIGAALYHDQTALDGLVASGILTDGSLCVGFLVVEGSPVVVRHEEHDPITLAPGNYCVGRQREFDAGAVRRVAD